MSSVIYKGRPFLVINATHHPKKGVRTERKGWQSIEENWESTETPSVVYRLSTSNIQCASVIIDIVYNTVVKNRFSDSPAEEVISYYLTKYEEEVRLALYAHLQTVVDKSA